VLGGAVAWTRPSGNQIANKSVREGAPRRFRAAVEYDGTDFFGFQAQPGVRTVQGELEAALARLSDGERRPVDGAGRTDTGVHAIGQVIAFTYAGRLSAEELGRALDALLPADVAIRDVRRATTAFHPRRAARYREYRYTVWNGPRSPLHERMALGVRVPLDTAAMERAGSVLVGRHDFSAFGAADRQPVRTVHAVRVRRSGQVVTIDVRADAFLRGMVRRIVAVLLEVGRGKLNETDVRTALVARRPALDGAAAPARGLCLRRVVLGRRTGAHMETIEER
jgi:tRNA pseudouridine38-40 synthase